MIIILFVESEFSHFNKPLNPYCIFKRFVTIIGKLAKHRNRQQIIMMK